MSENTNDIQSDYNVGDGQGFINKEMWRATPANGEWTEIGETDGAFDPSGNGSSSYYRGIFGAVQYQGGYEEFALPVGAMDGRCHNFELAVDPFDPTYVDYVVDGTVLQVRQQSYAQSDYMAVGLESNNGVEPKFQQYTFYDSYQMWFQSYSPGATWQLWPANVNDFNDSVYASNPVSQFYTLTPEGNIMAPFLNFF